MVEVTVYDYIYAFIFKAKSVVARTYSLPKINIVQFSYIYIHLAIVVLPYKVKRGIRTCTDSCLVMITELINLHRMVTYPMKSSLTILFS